MTRKTWRDADIAAYLDGELGIEQHTLFETTLAHNVTLRHQVAAQRRVIDFIHEAPQHAPPRNYLLTPAMVSAPSVAPHSHPSRSLFVMRWATSLTALLFVISLGLTRLPLAHPDAMMMSDPVAKEANTFMVEEQMTAATLTTTVSQEKALAETELDADTSQIEHPRAVIVPPGEPALDVREGSSGESTPAAGGIEKTELLTVYGESAISQNGGVTMALPLSADSTVFTVTSEADWLITSTAPTAEYAPVEVHAPPVTSTNAKWAEVPYYLAWGTGMLTLLLAALTFWMSRRPR